MRLQNAAYTVRALQLVGELLAAEGHSIAIVISGGAALNLLGIVDRTTTDVDILAFSISEGDAAPAPASLREPPDPMPLVLQEAATTAGRSLGLGQGWLNTGPALQWRTGLPPELGERVSWQRFAGLWVGTVSRTDLIYFKLFAAADSSGTRSKHYQDLLALKPTTDELMAAAEWVNIQDASAPFADVLRQVVSLVRAELSGG